MVSDRIDSFWSEFADSIHGIVNGTPYGVILTPWNFESALVGFHLEGGKLHMLVSH
jgi:hypothetical protein